jgi:hypothetical protein
MRRRDIVNGKKAHVDQVNENEKRAHIVTVAMNRRIVDVTRTMSMSKVASDRGHGQGNEAGHGIEIMTRKSIKNDRRASRVAMNLITQMSQGENAVRSGKVRIVYDLETGRY